MLNYYKYLFADRKDEGVIEFDNLKDALLKYGDVLNEDDIDLMQKAFNASDGKIIVEGIDFFLLLILYVKFWNV